MKFLSRRLFLGTPLVALPAITRAAGVLFDYDVIVIGAGAAGLAAAHELKRIGRKYIVLEARARPGGRVYTDHTLGFPVDAGAFYLHWAEKNPLTQIARGVGVRTIEEDSAPRGQSRTVDRGVPPASREGLAQWDKLRETLDDPLSRVSDASVLDFAGGANAPAAEGALSMSRLALGEEAERVSALDYQRLVAGDDRLVPEGFGTVLERHARGLNIRYATPVRMIDWSGTGVQIGTDAGAINAQHVIVTVPLGVLQAETIRFTPSLPLATVRGIEGLAMGASTRIALQFDGERFGLTPHSSLRLRLSSRESFSFGCFAWNSEIVTVYFGGDHARAIIAMGEQAACQHVLEHFAGIVGASARTHFRAGRLHGWWSDPFARGAYSHARPGHADARKLLAQTIGGRITFAGEATGGVGGIGGAMTAGGAYLAGRTAARRVSRI